MEAVKVSGHPTYFPEAKVTCVCGNTFTVGSTLENIHVELCNKCHPFYTGEQKFVDTGSRIQKFQKKQDVASKYKVTKKEKEEKRKTNETPKTLREMLMGLK